MTDRGGYQWLARAGRGVAVALVLGACGSGGSDQAKSTATPSSTSTTVAAVTTLTAAPPTVLVTTSTARSASPTTRPSGASGSSGGATAGPRRTPVAGFGEIAFQVAGRSATRCALLASTPEQRRQGLMGRTDLAGYDGMLFVFPSEQDSGFWMKDTPMPLSIAFFDSDGGFVSSADMEPCMDRGNDCPVYRPAGPYRTALEVQQGGLSGLGIGPGASIAAGGGCS